MRDQILQIIKRLRPGMKTLLMAETLQDLFEEELEKRVAGATSEAYDRGHSEALAEDNSWQEGWHEGYEVGRDEGETIL